MGPSVDGNVLWGSGGLDLRVVLKSFPEPVPLIDRPRNGLTPGSIGLSYDAWRP
jgi:hypothetical protein